jgi:hypothetical protein
MRFFYTGTLIKYILYIQHEIKEEEEHEDDGDAFVEDVDEGDMEDEVDNDHTLEAEDFEEGEPSATSTPRRGHLPRPLVRSGFEFLIRIWETTKNLTNQLARVVTSEHTPRSKCVCFL